jgi:hypothetical protein
VVRLLEEHHGANVPVAAIFMRPGTEESQSDIFTSILQSINRQLIEKSSRFDTSPSQNSRITTSGSRNREFLQRSICATLLDLPGAFLVLDDLDQCGYQTVQLLEEEFTLLRKHGLRIMTTSRVARFTWREWWCHVSLCSSSHPEHSIPLPCDVWVCKKCYEEVEQAEEQEKGEMLDNMFAVCNSYREAGGTETMCHR